MWFIIYAEVKYIIAQRIRGRKWKHTDIRGVIAFEGIDCGKLKMYVLNPRSSTRASAQTKN